MTINGYEFDVDLTDADIIEKNKGEANADRQKKRLWYNSSKLWEWNRPSTDV